MAKGLRKVTKTVRRNGKAARQSFWVRADKKLGAVIRKHPKKVVAGLSAMTFAVTVGGIQAARSLSNRYNNR